MSPDRQKRGRKRCEAEVHVEECDGSGTTTDHFTPRSIAPRLGWSRDTLLNSDNKQQLSPACHAAKDNDTSYLARLLEDQQSGKFIPIGGHTSDSKVRRLIEVNAIKAGMWIALYGPNGQDR